MDLLTPSSGLIIWMTLVFLIVFLILKKWGFPVIIKMVNDRKEYVDNSLLKAKQAELKLDNIKVEGESIIQGAREEQAIIIKDATATREAIVAKAQEKAREEAARLLEEARQEIQVEKENAIREIKNQTAELSLKVSELILKDKLKGADAQMDYINRLLDDVSSSKSQSN